MEQKNWREKILDHLAFARQWLERAEKNFSRDDTLQGELNLALVEAEVRHAWEMSAGKRDPAEIELAEPIKPSWLPKLILAGVIVAFGLWRWGGRTQEELPQPQITAEAGQEASLAPVRLKAPQAPPKVPVAAKSTPQAVQVELPESKRPAPEVKPVEVSRPEPEPQVVTVKEKPPLAASVPAPPKEELPKSPPVQEAVPAPEPASGDLKVDELAQLARDALYGK